ncbi:hypothetical protein KKC_06697, partial [Listeria fleischmannii subsp. coloradonensis]|uniref:hypothetical protein n=1 Tax=Listeria fleischmannii TaxID=1069827 RepID=UPI000254F079
TWCNMVQHGATQISHLKCDDANFYRQGFSNFLASTQCPVFFICAEEIFSTNGTIILNFNTSCSIAEYTIFEFMSTTFQTKRKQV